MESFDQSLKYLLQHEPTAFLAFALRDPTVRILAAVPSVLPSRGRDVDGGYLITVGAPLPDAPIPDEAQRIAHIEMYRRHQSVTEVGVDIAEAQVRLFRREGKLVLSHLWDLYGDPATPVRQERRLPFGADGSTCVYQRINLRGMTWKELLEQAPPALWALVALTRDGATEAVVKETLGAIDAHLAWTPAERSDHVAVLWFVAEAEGVPGKLMRAAITKERLMESAMYREIIEEGEARGEAKSILKFLRARDIAVSDAIRARILGCTDPATLDLWIERAAVVSTAAAVVRAKAPTRPGGAGAARHAQKR